MLTDRDVTIRAVADGRDPKITAVEEVMTRQVAYCFEDQDTEEAERLMEKNQIRRLPVLDREKCVVGIVSLGTSPSKTMKTVRERRWRESLNILDGH
jgi:CBS domain-containing protein